MGRQKKEINWNIVEKKIEAGCSAKEIYENVCHKDTFYDRFKEEYGENFSDYSTEYYHVGNGNLKFTQYIKALSGNIPMLLLLGRERLGQGKSEETVSPLQMQIDQSHILMEQSHEIAELKNQVYELRKNADKSKTE